MHEGASLCCRDDLHVEARTTRAGREGRSASQHTQTRVRTAGREMRQEGGGQTRGPSRALFCVSREIGELK